MNVIAIVYLKCLIVGVVCNSSLVNNYINLINQELEIASTYILPEDASEYKTKTSFIHDAGTYDYIIIGAGSTGAVVANRLSENKDDGVLLLEAGENISEFARIPGMSGHLLKSKYNWNYFSTPQTTACLGMNNQQCYYPRGKGLGGTSILFGLCYARGNKEDFDRWSSEGNPGWSYEDVLPYFKKSENYSVGNRYRGTKGYLNLETLQPETELGKAFFEANYELGRNLLDFNGMEQMGVGKLQLTTRNGKRLSSRDAFLTTTLHRNNLKVSQNSFVTKILIDDNNTAYGVMYTKNNIAYMVKASKEVILSAGVIGSPQILMLSGIGPRAHLEQLSIPVVADLPVGDNLQDHVGYLALVFSTNYTMPYRNLEDNIQDYIRNTGPLIRSINAEAITFTKTHYSKPGGNPDMELLFLTSANPGGFSPLFQNLNNVSFKIMESNWNFSNSFQILLIMTHPKSRGRIRLRSSDPFAYPLIDSNMLSDPDEEDLKVLYEGIQLAIQISNTKAFQKYNTVLKDNTMPECKHYKYLSKDYWYCQMKQFGQSCYQSVGTCKMGSDTLKSVVDPKLRVHGIKNLRVADTSVFPSHVSGHPVATTTMIGERVSDFIKNSIQATLENVSIDKQ